MKKIKQVFLFLIFSQKEFLKPKRNKILIFDGTNYIPLLKSLRTKEISILFIRGEIINFYILSKVFFNKIYLIFYPTLFWKEYLFNYIETVNPKIILTYIDNNPFFYTLKKKFTSKTFISIQNGYRFKKGDLFGKLINKKREQLYCDYIFCFNKNVAKMYEKFINCKTIIIGSLKNNLTKISNNYKSKKILLISSFGLKSEKAEKKLIAILSKYCLDRNIKLMILGRTGLKDELDFYNKISANNCFTYLKNKREKSIHYSYNIIDSCNTIISLNATLGYESLGRGKKTIFFNFNEREKNCKSYITYNWPSKFYEEGFNWLAIYKEKKIINKLYKVYELSDKEWKNKYRKQYSFIMPIDTHNQKLRKVIKKII